MKLLFAVTFFFSQLSVLLRGDILYPSDGNLEETGYKEKNLRVLNLSESFLELRKKWEKPEEDFQKLNALDGVTRRPMRRSWRPWRRSARSWRLGRSRTRVSTEGWLERPAQDTGASCLWSTCGPRRQPFWYPNLAPNSVLTLNVKLGK